MMNQKLGIGNQARRPRLCRDRNWISKHGNPLFRFLLFLILLAPFFVAKPAQTQVVELGNPLGTTDFRLIVGNIIKTLTGGAGMLALLMFIYGGFTWLTAAGNSEKIQKGRDILVWSTAGMVVMFSSYFIVRFIILGITRGVVAP